MIIQEDSYWYVESDMVRAMCLECGSKNSEVKTWFWDGSNRGYVDELNCSICKTPIYLKNENDTTEEKEA